MIVHATDRGNGSGGGQRVSFDLNCCEKNEAKNEETVVQNEVRKLIYLFKVVKGHDYLYCQILSQHCLSLLLKCKVCFTNDMIHFIATFVCRNLHKCKRPFLRKKIDRENFWKMIPLLSTASIVGLARSKTRFQKIPPILRLWSSIDIIAWGWSWGSFPDVYGAIRDQHF